MSEPKLKPCPLCGSPARLLRNDYWQGVEAKVICENEHCGCSVGSRLRNRSDEAVVARWNNRCV